MFNKRNEFTVIELVISIAIISMFFVIAVPQLKEYKMKKKYGSAYTAPYENKPIVKPIAKQNYNLYDVDNTNSDLILNFNINGVDRKCVCK